MSKKANPTIIGLFTLLGLVLAGVAMVLFGAGRIFKDTHDVLLYFEKSANGLQIGSDVRFGGVRIGTVKSINVVIDKVANRKVIPVVVELGEKEMRLIQSEGGGGLDFSTFEGVEKAVSEGLRAGMKQQSLLTGQLYIEFDISPDSEGFIYQNGAPPRLPVVPTVATEMDELIAGVADGLKKFNALDLNGVMSDLRDVLVNARDQISDLNMKDISDNVLAITKDVRTITGDEKLTDAVSNLNSALSRIDDLAAKANQGIDPMLADINAVLQRTDASLLRIQQAADEMNQLSNPRAPVLMRLQSVLQETERASRALKELSVDLKRQPRALLSGKAIPE